MRVGEQGAEGGGGGDVGGFNEQALGRIAHPTVGVRQEFHASGDVDRDLRGLGGGLVIADDTPDAALVDRRLQLARLDVGDEVVREEARVLQHSAVEVYHVERAIGSGGGHHGAEAFVGRRQEFFFFVGVGTREQAILFGDDHALHQIRRRLRDKSVAAEFGGEGVTSVDACTAGGGGVCKGAVGPERLSVVATVDAGGRMGRVDRLVFDYLVVDPEGIAEERIAGIGRGRKEVGTKEVGVVVVEQAAGVVLAQAPLAAAEPRPFLPGAVVELETCAVTSRVDSVVHRPRRRVGHVFGLAAEGAEVGGDQDLLVSGASALRVAAEEKVRRFGHEGAAFDRHHAARHHQVVEEGRGLIHAAVAVRIGEERDTSKRFFFRGAFHVAHVAAHLDDEEPALFVKADGDRGFDHRFAGDELDAEAGRKAEALQGFFGREGCRCRQVELQLNVGGPRVTLIEGESGRSSDEQS